MGALSTIQSTEEGNDTMSNTYVSKEYKRINVVKYDKYRISAAEGIVMITFGVPTIVASDEGIAILVFELPINIFLQILMLLTHASLCNN